MYVPAVSHNLGLGESPSIPRVMVRGGAKVKGQVVMFDLAASDPDTTNFQQGSEASAIVNVILPSAAARKGKGLLAVLRDDCADNLKEYATFRGFCEALVIKASGNIAIGDPLAVNTSGYLTADLEAGDKIVAHARAAVTAPTSATLAKVAFDGKGGFGVWT